MFCSIQSFFLAFPLPLSSSCFLYHPFPPHSSFSVFPSFLIHFLCITPSLSTPIYSALPPPFFHKHTLYFSLFPSVTLLPSSLSHSPSVHYVTFPLLLLLSPLLSLCFLLWLHHPILGTSFNLIFTLHLHCHSVVMPQSVGTAVILPFKCLFKDVIWFLMLTVIFTTHMSANVINNTCNFWFLLAPCLFHTQTY